MVATPSDRVAEALALREPLTGLTDRRGWDLLVAEAQQRVDLGESVAVAVITIDDLAAVNDSKGRNAGDEIIRRSAGALKAVCGSTDRLVRHGGDEFAVLANNVPDAELEEHFGIFVDAMAAHGVSGSIGFAATCPEIGGVLEAFAMAEADLTAAKLDRDS